MPKLKMTDPEILAYLDKCIDYWRSQPKDDRYPMCYVDAFQSVRVSLFGELKPTADGSPVIVEIDPKTLHEM